MTAITNNHVFKRTYDEDVESVKRPCNSKSENLGYILDQHSHPSKFELPLESTLEIPHLQFFQNLTQLESLPCLKERLVNFTNSLELVRDESPETKSEVVQAECWIPFDNHYLHLIVGGGPHFSTFLPPKNDTAPNYIFINLAEWKDINGGERQLPSVQLRIDLETGHGEWMWIRKSSSFSGNQAVEWASAFSRAFLNSAEMIDVSRVPLARKISMQLSTFNALAKDNPLSFYSKSGFEVVDILNQPGNGTPYNQSADLYYGAIHYLRSIKVNEIVPLFKNVSHKDKSIVTSTHLSLVAKHYNGENDELKTLCQKVSRAALSGQVFAIEHREILYKIISGQGAFKIEGRMFSMATRINGSEFILRALAPFHPVVNEERDVENHIANFVASYELFSKQTAAKLNHVDFAIWYLTKKNR